MRKAAQNLLPVQMCVVCRASIAEALYDAMAWERATFSHTPSPRMAILSGFGKAFWSTCHRTAWDVQYLCSYDCISELCCYDLRPVDNFVIYFISTNEL